MIDIENEVFNTVASALRSRFHPIAIYGEVVDLPAVFPCVMMVEKDNRVYARTQTGLETENHALLMYEIDVCSNKQSGKKSEVKEIFSVIDAEMAELGFSRIMLAPMPNLWDGSIYRMVGRYQAVVSVDHVIYRG